MLAIWSAGAIPPQARQVCRSTMEEIMAAKKKAAKKAAKKTAKKKAAKKK
jgi:hypothetical protein